MKFSKVRDVKSPERGTAKSAGIDFFIPNDFKETTLLAHEDILIPSGIKIKVPEGCMLCAFNKSGVATSYAAVSRVGRAPKKNAFVSSLLVGACVDDEDYQGELHLHVVNVGHSEVILKPGMKIVQFVIIPIRYDNLEEVAEQDLFNCVSERGDGAFGHTDNSETNLNR